MSVPGRSPFLPYVGALLLGCAAAWVPSGALAGGGPENVLLVVNRDSVNSLTIANHYLRLRQIPAGNVLTLPWGHNANPITVDKFRQEILLPVLKSIQQRRLSAQIDYIVYSSDFPIAIDLGNDVDQAATAGSKIALPTWPAPHEDKAAWPTHLTTMGSLNGLTYLWEPVLVGNPLYMHLRSNQYLRQDVAQQKGVPSVAFKSSLSFGPHGELLRPGVLGRRYVLSRVLGVTAERGNSLEDVLRYLARNAAADGTHPRGTIYYAENSDIRSKVRQQLFPAAVKQLKAMGIEAEIVDGILPPRRPDVQGLMTGAPDFAWKACGSQILPGAICEHFTSFGADMGRLEQTKFSEFLRYGAAAASGTVVEPYAIAEKFPEAAMHLHYARGCTLAEAYYQSISGPYQLLIVGDPLCRPWANIPQVTVSGVEPGATVHGQITLKPAARFSNQSTVDHFELFVDELRKSVCPAEGSFLLDTARLADGHHELRVVAVEAGLIASQGRQIVPIITANHDHTIEATVEPKGTVAFDKPLVITAKCPESMGIAVMHNSQMLGKITGASGRLEINPTALGLGPVLLRVVGLGDGTPINYVWAEPLQLTVEKQ
jgi:hypothetical protein